MPEELAPESNMVDRNYIENLLRSDGYGESTFNYTFADVMKNRGEWISARKSENLGGEVPSVQDDLMIMYKGPAGPNGQDMFSWKREELPKSEENYKPLKGIASKEKYSGFDRSKLSE